MNYLKNIIILGLLIVITSCSNNLTTEGNFVFPNNLDKVKNGITKDQVIDLLGPTTIKASFNENTWYYIYEVSKKRLRFFNKTVVSSKVIIIDFNDNKVKNVKVLDYKQRRKISVDNSQTANILIKTDPKNNKFKEIDTFNDN